MAQCMPLLKAESSSSSEFSWLLGNLPFPVLEHLICATFYMLCVSVLSHLLNAFILSLIFCFALISLWPPAIGNYVLTWSPPLRKLLIQLSSGWSTGGSHPICRLEVSCETCTPRNVWTEPDFLTPILSWRYELDQSVTLCCLLDYCWFNTQLQHIVPCDPDPNHCLFNWSVFHVIA